MNDKNKKIINLPVKELHITPLTRKELHEASRKRVSLISKEFTQGFDFLTNYPKSVTFFGSANFKEDNKYYIQAKELASKISKELGYTIVSGGGPGIMEAANRGAYEVGGQSVGLTIELPKEQAINPFVQSQVDFYYFFSRKVCLSFSAEAYIFFPGGFGTMDEFFEIITLVQTHKIHPVPIILVGSDFWNSFEKFIKDELLSRGAIDKNDLTLYTITDDVSKIIDIIKNAPVRNGETFEMPDVKESKISEMNKLLEKECVPCEGGVAPLNHEQSEKLLEDINQWILVEDKYIEKIVTFENWKKAIQFVDHIAYLAEIEGHHPNVSIFDFNKVKITLTTHAIGGLSENDFIMAAKIDEILR